MFATSDQKAAVDLLAKIHREAPKVNPKVKEITDVQMPDFNEVQEEMSDAVTFKHTPNKFMKYMDTSMEKFFYQRDYTLQNFNFYLQVLSAQYKVEEAEKAFERMQILGLQPDKETFNHLITVNAKSK